MPKFQVVSPHDPSECLLTLDEMLESDPEFLKSMLLGCHFGDHTGYAVIDASSEEEVRNRLPTVLRKKARVVAVEPPDAEAIMRGVHERAV